MGTELNRCVYNIWYFFINKKKKKCSVVIEIMGCELFSVTGWLFYALNRVYYIYHEVCISQNETLKTLKSILSNNIIL